jgi:hypothetical protein
MHIAGFYNIHRIYDRIHDYIAVYSFSKARCQNSLVPKAPMPIAMSRHMLAAALPASAAPFAPFGLPRHLQQAGCQAKMPKIAKRKCETLLF